MRKRRVLVADDEPLFRSTFAEAIAVPKGALDVMTAADGSEALSLLRQHDVDLLITDVNMPGVGGIELVKEFMRLQPGRPAIVMTAYGSPEIEEEVKHLGGISYLEKPIDLGVAHARVEQALRARAQGHLEGVTHFGFLQLLELERKTCTLRLRLEGRSATLWIRAGEIVHAEAEGLVGDQAVVALGDWEAPEIDIENVCLTDQHTVRSSMAELLFEAARLADEHREYGKPGRSPEPAPAQTTAATPVPGNSASTGERKATERDAMANLKETLTRLSEIDGFIGACVVDSTSGMMLGSEGGGAAIDLEVAAAGNTEVVRAKRKTMASLGLKDAIEDILITLGRQYHLIRPLSQRDGLFAYLVLDKARSNLAMARHSLSEAEKALTI